MPLPKEVLEGIKKNIETATSKLNELKEVVQDMRLAGMKTETYDNQIDELETEIRRLKVFYESQNAKHS